MIAASGPWTLPVAAATKAEQARAAAKLVQETLEREAKEGIPDRWELLQPAVLQAPHCEAAYWLSGFVYDSKRKQWLRWDEVQQLAAEDSRLTAYRHARRRPRTPSRASSPWPAGRASTSWRTKRGRISPACWNWTPIRPRPGNVWASD